MLFLFTLEEAAKELNISPKDFLDLEVPCVILDERNKHYRQKEIESLIKARVSGKIAAEVKPEEGITLAHPPRKHNVEFRKDRNRWGFRITSRGKIEKRYRWHSKEDAEKALAAYLVSKLAPSGDEDPATSASPTPAAPKPSPES